MARKKKTASKQKDGSQKKLEVVRDIFKEVPVYKDAIRPGAKKLGTELVPAAENIGRAATTVTEGINVALTPLKLLVWCYDQVEEIIFPTLAERFKDKLRRMVTPPLSIAGPVIESLRFTGSEESIREMYVNLLEDAMDSETIHRAHPSFVEIIRQLSPDEAMILKAIVNTYNGVLHTITLSGPSKSKYESQYTFLERFSDYELRGECRFPDLMPSYLDNLCRLGITRHPQRNYSHNAAPLQTISRGHTVILIEHRDIVAMAAKVTEREDVREPQFFVEGFYLTSFGEQFCRTCVAKPTEEISADSVVNTEPDQVDEGD